MQFYYNHKIAELNFITLVLLSTHLVPEMISAYFAMLNLCIKMGKCTMSANNLLGSILLSSIGSDSIKFQIMCIHEL